MKTLTQSISILAMGAALAVAAPADIPTWEQGALSWNDAEAANIRRNRLKERNNGLYKSSVTTVQGGGDTSTVSEVEVSVSTIEGRVLVSQKAKKADTQTASYKEVTGLSAEIEVVDYQDGSDSFNMPTSPGETTTAELGKTRTTLSVTLQPDGSFAIALSGAPKDMNAFCADNVKKTETCGNFNGSLRLGGVELEVSEIESEWSVNLPAKIKGQSIDDSKVVVSSTAIGEDGEVLDQSTTVETAGEDRGIELEFAYFRVGPDGGGLIVANQPEDIAVEQRLDARIGTDSIDANLINVSDLPATPYREFYTPEITFIEPDNVVDMEYKFTTSFFDEIGNFLFSANVRGSGREENGLDFLIFEEPFEGPAPTEPEVSLRFRLNADGETFSLNLGVFGELARTAATLRVFIQPDDGGSEADPAEIEVAESAYLNLWRLPASAESFDLLTASGEVDYAFSLSTDGDLQDTLQGKSGTVRTLVGDNPFYSMEDLEDRAAADDDDGVKIAIIDTGIDPDYGPPPILY